MSSIFNRLAARWRKSVVFKLGFATGSIVLLVMLVQLFISLQIVNLNAVQGSIAVRSVPLFERTQEFARLTTRELSLTNQLDQDLGLDKLTLLQRQFLRTGKDADNILRQIDGLFADHSLVRQISESRRQFVEVSARLFEIKFDQRLVQNEATQTNLLLQNKATDFTDVVDQMMVVATTRALNAPLQNDTNTQSNENVTLFLSFANEIEILNSLKNEILDIRNALRGAALAAGTATDTGLVDQIGLRIGNIAKLLVSLEPSEERVELAKLAREMAAGISGSAGFGFLVTRLNELQNLQKELRALQTDNIDRITDQVATIVERNSQAFQKEISLADRLSKNVFLIGVSMTLLVLSIILFINDRVIQKQISHRLIAVFDDVSAIAAGDFEREIRVTGDDELANIAHALTLYKSQASELVRSNADLESFAQAAAHDLRSPLDAIQDLAKWTLEDERENLSESCIQNLELLIKRSERLSKLQSDLLTYARVGAIETNVVAFSVQDELAVISDLLDPNGDFNITLQQDPGTVLTYATPVRQILLNLISNALKHHDRDHGHINVSFNIDGQEQYLIVQDDGPGIETRFQSRIFELFKTLQRRDQVEGSGVGLALVVKLLERLGGEISVSSDAPTSRGTKFVVRVPNPE